MASIQNQLDKERYEKQQRRNARILDTRNNLEKAKIYSQLKALQIMSKFVNSSYLLC